MASLSTCHLELVVWDGNLVKVVLWVVETGANYYIVVLWVGETGKLLHSCFMGGETGGGKLLHSCFMGRWGGGMLT